MKRVIVIAHAPCSSGTFLTHWLLQKLGKDTWFIPETNLYLGSDRKKDELYSQSPLVYCLISKQVTFENWKVFYNKQIKYIVDNWKKNKSSEYLLIRDWTYAEYFNTGREVTTPNIVEILNKENIDVKFILSHRDPIDCWLGLNSSFPNLAGLMELDEYAKRYMTMTKSWENIAKENEFASIKLESLVRHKDEKTKILSYIGLTHIDSNGSSSPIYATDLTSGASGRKYRNLMIPRRRRVTYSGARKIQNSKKLIELRKYLEYDVENESITSSIIATIINMLTKLPVYIFRMKKKREKAYLRILKKINLNFY